MRCAIVGSFVVLLLLAGGPLAGTSSEETTFENLGNPSKQITLDALGALVEDFAQAIETNNLELALSYIHPSSPRKLEIQSALREQLPCCFERARTADLTLLAAHSGMASARIDQQIVRVFGMKLARATRRSTYEFRAFGKSWRIWSIH